MTDLVIDRITRLAPEHGDLLVFYLKDSETAFDDAAIQHLADYVRMTWPGVALIIAHNLRDVECLSPDAQRLLLKRLQARLAP